MPHVTISSVENEEIGVEKWFSHSFFISRLNGKVDKILSCFFSLIFRFTLHVSMKGCILCYRLNTHGVAYLHFDINQIMGAMGKKKRERVCVFAHNL